MCKILWLVYNFKEYCEAQGKGRSKGRLRKVTQRSFVDYRLSIIDILSLSYAQYWSIYSCITSLQKFREKNYLEIRIFCQMAAIQEEERRAILKFNLTFRTKTHSMDVF